MDTLPKHWGGAGSAAVSGQLDDKTNEHVALLHALEDGGCLPRLPASVLRCVLVACMAAYFLEEAEFACWQDMQNWALFTIISPRETLQWPLMRDANLVIFHGDSIHGKSFLRECAAWTAC